MGSKPNHCFQVGDLVVEVSKKHGYKYRVVVPYVGRNIPLSSWFGSFAQVKAYVEGVVAGVELTLAGVELMKTDAQCCYRDALHETLNTMRGYDLENELY